MEVAKELEVFASDYPENINTLISAVGSLPPRVSHDSARPSSHLNSHCRIMSSLRPHYSLMETDAYSNEQQRI
jgi:hypothetical protein